MILKLFKSILLIFVVFIFFEGCSKRPSGIGAVYFSPDKFSKLTCDDINSEIYWIENNTLPDLYKKQNKKVKDDIFSLGLSKAFNLSYDYENQIARAKGELEALYGALEIKGCRKKLGYLGL